MKYNIVFENDRPIVVAIEKFPQENGILLDVPESFEIKSAQDWTYQDGVWKYDPLPDPEPPRETETADDVLNALLGVTV